MTRPTALVFDFDSTLAHYVSGYDGLYDIFVSRGVPDEIVRTTYRQVTDEQGFSVTKLIDALIVRAALVAAPSDRDAIDREFVNWLTANLVLYPDVALFLEVARTDHHTIIILTYGDPTFQQQKIAVTGLTVDRLVVIDKADGKPEALKKLVNEFGAPLLFVDDKARDIDLIREAKLDDSHVRCVRILRPDSPYRDEVNVHPAPTIESLNELKTMLS